MPVKASAKKVLPSCFDYDSSWLEPAPRFQDDLADVHPIVPDPARMHFDLQCHLALKQAAGAPAVRRPKGWDDEGFDERWQTRLSTQAELDEFLAGQWVASEIYQRNSGRDDLDSLDEAIADLEETENDPLLHFIRNPTREAASQFTRLAADPVAFIDQVRRFELRKAAKQILTFGETLNLRTPPSALDGLPGPLELWLQVVPTPSGVEDEDEDPTVFSIRACVAIHEPGAAPRIIGYLTGPYIPVCDLDPDLFFDTCDAHSLELNDVWRSIQMSYIAGNEDVLETFGLEILGPCFNHDLDDKAALDEFDLANMRFGLCAPWIEVHPDFRGLGVTEWMMRKLTEVTLDPVIARHVNGSRVREPGERYAIRTTAKGMLQMLKGAPLRLYCMAVHSTPNEARSRRNILARGSTEKLPSPAVLDFEVEKRRKSLLRHFEAINAKKPAFFIHSYDPNSMVST